MGAIPTSQANLKRRLLVMLRSLPPSYRAQRGDANFECQYQLVLFVIFVSFVGFGSWAGRPTKERRLVVPPPKAARERPRALEAALGSKG